MTERHRHFIGSAIKAGVVGHAFGVHYPYCICGGMRGGRHTGADGLCDACRAGDHFYASVPCDD